MPIGRPRLPGTESERAEARRAKVRANVQAFRKRQKEKKLANQVLVASDDEDQFLQFILNDDHDSDSLLLSADDISLRSSSSSPNPDPYLSIAASSTTTIQNPESWLWAIPLELGVKIGGTSHKDTFTAVLQNEYLIADTSLVGSLEAGQERSFSICCGTWTTSLLLNAKRQETSVLMQAMLAAALAIVGRDRKDQDVALHAAYVQSQALRRFRWSLTKYEEGDQSIDPMLLSVTALTCAMSELIANQSWPNFNRHLLGVGALIFHGGISGLKTRAAQENFYGYRAVQTPFLFMNRQSAFLSNPEWIDFPNKDDFGLAQIPLNSLFDVALKILPEIVKQDMAKKWKLSCLKERLERATKVSEELDAWERRLRSQNQGGLYTKTPATWGGLHDLAFEFITPSVAVAFAMYTAVRIHVASVIANVAETVVSLGAEASVDPSMAVQQALRWCRIACQCLEFFHTSHSEFRGRVITLWPLETAWELFSRLHSEGSIDMSRETTWCRSAAERLALVGIPPYQWR